MLLIASQSRASNTAADIRVLFTCQLGPGSVLQLVCGPRYGSFPRCIFMYLIDGVGQQLQQNQSNLVGPRHGSVIRRTGSTADSHVESMFSYLASPARLARN